MDFPWISHGFQQDFPFAPVSHCLVEVPRDIPGAAGLRASRSVSQKKWLFYIVVPQFDSVQLVYNYNFCRTYGRYIELVDGGYKLTYNWGAPSCTLW